MNINHLQAYELQKEENLPGIQAKGYLLRHKKSGARVLLVENDDENKVFSIGFRTPPSDSTGVPHIWNIRFCAVLKIFLQKTRLWSWLKVR